MTSMAKTYHILNFDNLNDKGLKPLMTAIKAAGGNVVKLEPAGTARKKDGVQMKQFSLINADGQVIAVNVSQNGDITSATLNGKIYPALSPTSVNDMAQRIVAAFNANESAFANSLAKKLARAANTELDKATRAGVKSNTQRLSESKAKVSTLQGNIDELNGLITTQQTRLDSVKNTKESGTTTLNAEAAKQKQLLSEIQRIEAEINELSA